jgi:hypothetical protein
MVGTGFHKHNAPVKMEWERVDKDGEAGAAVVRERDAHAKPFGAVIGGLILYAVGDENRMIGQEDRTAG